MHRVVRESWGEPLNPMYSRKIYASVSSTTNAAASLTIPSRGRLLGIQWAVKFDNATDNAEGVFELSLAAATEVGVNAAQQCISEVAFYTNFTTSGLALGNQNLWLPVDIPVNQGQLIYLHAVITGTATLKGGAILWIA